MLATGFLDANWARHDPLRPPPPIAQTFLARVPGHGHGCRGLGGRKSFKAALRVEQLGAAFGSLKWRSCIRRSMDAESALSGGWGSLKAASRFLALFADDFGSCRCWRTPYLS